MLVASNFPILHHLRQARWRLWRTTETTLVQRAVRVVEVRLHPLQRPLDLNNDLVAARF